MARYANSEQVKLLKSQIAKIRYTRVWKPGENPDAAGIYRCQGCGYEDVINRECTKLPPCSNCEKNNHSDNTWKLLVRAEDAE
ncbi:hypothetical protein BK796_23245 [Kosakonia pseudosacchari]|uniref:Uncharacterized protein n=1 Tax=Kosakonia pseudosacchari TaxID=1646340 RepID=A0ABX4IKS1_9ENTR|nr:hypothetical protein BK796_23245 [Kosakonia pseudosacchari]